MTGAARLFKSFATTIANDLQRLIRRASRW